MSPGRPRAFDTEAALDRALELFWRSGYRVTTRDLEAGLDLNASSLYNAFGSKEALLLAVVDRYETRITGGLLEPLESSPLGLPALDRFFRDLGRWITREGRRGCLLVNLMAEDAEKNEALAERLRVYRERLRRALRGALERAAEAGEMRPGDAKVRAELLLGQVFGLNVAARGGAKPPELRQMLSAVREQMREWSRTQERRRRPWEVASNR